jgi:hypothetical protein
MKDKVNTIVIATLAGAVGALGVGVISGAGADNAASSEPVVVRVDQPAAADTGPTECPAEVGAAEVGAVDAAGTGPSSTSTANSASTASAAADSNSTGNESQVIVENNNSDTNINDNENINANSNDSDNTNNNSLTANQAQTVTQTVNPLLGP